jgi:hypothetical protein
LTAAFEKPVTNRASSRLVANPFGRPATNRTIVDDIERVEQGGERQWCVR